MSFYKYIAFEKKEMHPRGNDFKGNKIEFSYMCSITKYLRKKNERKTKHKKDLKMAYYSENRGID